MSGEVTLAQTPQEISALRAQILLEGADEIAKIDRQNTGPLNKGRIGVAIDVVKNKLGKSAAEFAQNDNRVLSLLTEAVIDVYKIRVTGPAHLYDFLNGKLKKDICAIRVTERNAVETLIRRISAKLVNGHAGTWF